MAIHPTQRVANQSQLFKCNYSSVPGTSHWCIKWYFFVSNAWPFKVPCSFEINGWWHLEGCIKTTCVLKVHCAPGFWAFIYFILKKSYNNDCQGLSSYKKGYKLGNKPLSIQAVVIIVVYRIVLDHYPNHGWLDNSVQLEGVLAIRQHALYFWSQNFNFNIKTLFKNQAVSNISNYV